MKKCIPIMLVLVGVMFVYKKTNYFSYAGAFLAQTQNEVEDQIPTSIEIERIRCAIGSFEDDVGNMIRPIAEYMDDIKELNKEIRNRQTELDKQRGDLLTMTKDLEGNPSIIVYDGKKYSAERIRGKLQSDFESFKQNEAYLQTLKTRLDTTEKSLQAAKEKLATAKAKIGEYKLRLAQIVNAEETEKLAAMGSPIKTDNTRSSMIESGFAKVERRHSVQKNMRELKTGKIANDSIPVGRPKEPAVDVINIRNYLEGPPLASTSTVGKN